VADKDKILKRIKDSVKATAPGATLILYGSYARGDYREDSDIDILVLTNEEKITYQEKKNIVSPIYHIELETGIIISTMFLSKKTWDAHCITPFYKNVMKEGLVL